MRRSWTPASGWGRGGAASPPAPVQGCDDARDCGHHVACGPEEPPSGTRMSTWFPNTCVCPGGQPCFHTRFALLTCVVLTRVFTQKMTALRVQTVGGVQLFHLRSRFSDRRLEPSIVGSRAVPQDFCDNGNVSALFSAAATSHVQPPWCRM